MEEKYFFWKILCVTAILFFADCKVPYDPPLKNSNKHNLVVEGFINGAAPTIIKLSRTRTVADTALPLPENGARVFVEDNHNNSYRLLQTDNGIYADGSLPLNPSYRYRIHIYTTNDKEYLSDFVPVNISPPIDSINWIFKNGGVQIYTNTHDPNNVTPYYRWEFSETWEVQMQYYSYYKYVLDSNKVIPRSEQVYQCWPDNNSTNIIIGSAANLKNNVIYRQPITYITNHAQRISLLYSIEVKQYALDTAAYNFWLALKQNTEQIGSIFDPQPSNIYGNIHCINVPSELAVGYIGAGIISKSRIFISNKQMPSNWNPIGINCAYTVVPDIKDSLKFYFGNTPYTPIDKGPGFYTAALTSCVDCTLKGTNIKPSFWP